jgi:hypothetical protein
MNSWHNSAIASYGVNLWKSDRKQQQQQRKQESQALHTGDTSGTRRLTMIQHWLRRIGIKRDRAKSSTRMAHPMWSLRKISSMPSLTSLHSKFTSLLSPNLQSSSSHTLWHPLQNSPYTSIYSMYEHTCPFSDCQYNLSSSSLASARAAYQANRSTDEQHYPYAYYTLSESSHPSVGRHSLSVLRPPSLMHSSVHDRRSATFAAALPADRSNWKPASVSVLHQTSELYHSSVKSTQQTGQMYTQLEGQQQSRALLQFNLTRFRKAMQRQQAWMNKQATSSVLALLNTRETEPYSIHRFIPPRLYLSEKAGMHRHVSNRDTDNLREKRRSSISSVSSDESMFSACSNLSSSSSNVTASITSNASSSTTSFYSARSSPESSIPESYVPNDENFVDLPLNNDSPSLKADHQSNFIFWKDEKLRKHYAYLLVSRHKKASRIELTSVVLLVLISCC